MAASSSSALKDLLIIPKADFGAVRVFRKNLFYFRRTFWISFPFLMLEPVLYLLAIGYGLGYFVGYIEGTPYLNYFVPGLIAMTGMMISFFESSYGSYSRFKNSRDFGALLSAPVSSDEIVVGEIMWAATKGFMSVMGVVVIAFLFGLIATWQVVPGLLLMGMGCWLFAALGMLVSSYARSTDAFIFAQTVLILPLALFCNTYFPLSSLSTTLSKVSWVLPLTHLVEVLREGLHGHITSAFWVSFVVVSLYSIAITNWSVARMSRKIFR